MTGQRGGIVDIRATDASVGPLLLLVRGADRDFVDVAVPAIIPSERPVCSFRR